jgi:hypothetical protein
MDFDPGGPLGILRAAFCWMSRLMEAIGMRRPLARLLAQKQQVIERLQENPGPQEHEELERLLEKIDTALCFLDEAGPGTGRRRDEP